MIYLEPKDVELQCQRGITKWDEGNYALRDRGLLESAVFAVQQVVFGVQPYPTLASAAAAYWFKIAKNHPFEQGNKRAGFLSAISFLRLNGHKLVMTNAEAIALGEAMMANEINDPHELAARLKIKRM